MPPTEKLTYTRLIAIRVTHTDPTELAIIADMLRDEVQEAFDAWQLNTKSLKDTRIEAFTLSPNDFPMKGLPS